MLGRMSSLTARWLALVLARIVEPTSKADSLRVLDELGVPHASLRTMFRRLYDKEELYQLLFTYGTLQHAEVQLDTFGRLVAGEPDALPGYTVDYVEIELAWWQSHRMQSYSGPLEIVFTPVQHWSGRSLTDRMDTLWGGILFALTTFIIQKFTTLIH